MKDNTAIFIASIAILLVINFIVVQRLNRDSYLHTPLRRPRFRFWRKEEPTIERPQAAPSVQRGKNAHATVDWVRSRNPAGQKQRQLKAEKPLSSPYHPKEREEVFVGMAIVDEKDQADKPAKPKGNVERWYQQASGH